MLSEIVGALFPNRLRDLPSYQVTRKQLMRSSRILNNLLGGVAVDAVVLVLLFAPLAFGERTILALSAPLGLLLLIARRESSSVRSVLSVPLSPFLPFVVAMMAVAPFQETTSESLHLVAMATVYVLARFIRNVLEVHHIAWGFSLSALAVGIARQLSQIDGLAGGELIEKVADINGRNPAGAIVGVGVVASVTLLVFYSGKKSRLPFAVATFASLLIMLLLSDTVAAIVAAVVALIVLLIFLLRKSAKAADTARFTRLPVWVVGAGVGVSGALLVIINIANLGGNELSDRLSRDFGTFTGRTTIWQCYVQALDRGAADPWQETVSCTAPSIPAHLHSIFLQSHLLAGWTGALILLGGFIAAYLITASGGGFQQGRYDVTQQVFSYGLLSFGLVLGLVESYLFAYLLTTLSLFVAPRIVSFQEIVEKQISFNSWMRPRKIDE